MRTIKHRGKRMRDGEWVYGNLLAGTTDKGVDVAFIAPNLPIVAEAYDFWGATMYRVDPATVGQFTGLFDEDGREIYEGDIIKIVEKFDDENVYTSNGVVCFEEGIYELQNGKHFAYLGWLMHNDDITKLEVIGNIHDNPDLIEKGGKE